MSRGKAITLAIFTAWPILYIVLFMCAVFAMMMSDFAGGISTPRTLFVLW
jgi:hypothetical protein